MAWRWFKSFKNNFWHNWKYIEAYENRTRVRKFKQRIKKYCRWTNEKITTVWKSAILESLLEHIVYQTTDNTIIYANKSAAESVNLKPEQLVGRKCYQIWNDREEPCEGCPIVKTIKTGNPTTTEISTPDGRIWYVAGYPVRDKDNNIIAVVESTLNITEKKTAEEKIKKSEEKYRKAYYQANLYRDIFAHDINNILQNINSSIELSSLYLNNPEKLNTIKEL